MPHVVLAYVTDLIFQTKIASTARALGTELRIAGHVERLENALADNAVTTVLIDLNASGDPLAALRAVRARQNPPRSVCYLSHVQKDLADAAHAAGADEVLPRSVFVARLPGLLTPPDGV